MEWRESVRIAALHEVARVQGIESAAQTCVSTLARNSRECGIVMPRPFAVLRLTINCNFVGSSGQVARPPPLLCGAVAGSARHPDGIHVR